MASRDEKLLQEYEEKMYRLAESSAKGLPLHEGAAEREARKEKLLKNYEQYCLHYFPEYCFSKMGKFQKNAIHHLKRRWNIVALLQWFREGAKSTHVFMYVLYQLLRGELNGFIGYSANQDLAMRLLMDLKANLEANQRLIHDWGEFKGARWEMDQFYTSKGIGFYAFGYDQTVRGTRFGHRRPNMASVDDLNDMRTLKNDKLSREKYERVKEDLMPALDGRRWQVLIPQNKFHRNTVTAFFENDAELKKKVWLNRVDLLDRRGRSSWPEHISTAAAKEKMQAMGYLSSQREYMNNPIEEGQVFKREDIRWVKRRPTREYDILVQYTDPSYKNTHKSDYKASVLIGKKALEIHVLKAWVQKTGQAEMFGWHYEGDDYIGDHSAIRHYMEANFIQNLHANVLPALQKEKGRPLRISQDMRSKPDKYQRISSMESLFQNGHIGFNSTEKDNPNMTRLIDQLLVFEKGSNINDDGPDALEGAIYKAEELTVHQVPPAFVVRRKSKFAY